MVMKLSRNQDKKIAQVCQAKNSGRNQQICEQCVVKKMIWKQRVKQQWWLTMKQSFLESNKK